MPLRSVDYPERRCLKLQIRLLAAFDLRLGQTFRLLVLGAFLAKKTHCKRSKQVRTLYKSIPV